MAAIVGEIMNAELFIVRPHDPERSALDGLVSMGITAAPVLDEDGHPLGVVSIRDFVGDRIGPTAGDHMTSPAAIVRKDTRISDAARLMGESGYRHLVVVDDSGRAIGMLSALDVVRALVGVPTRHPDAFPHLDPRTGLSFTSDIAFDERHLREAPDAPGVLVLVHDPPGAPQRVVWVQSVPNLRTRLADLLSLPQHDSELSTWLTHRAHLRFRVALTVP